MALAGQAVLIQTQVNLLEAYLDVHEYANQNKRRPRRWWCRAWLSPERRRHFGLYDRLITELWREDGKSFLNFLRMPPDMFDEILERVGPRITKQRTHFRDPLDPGLKLSITLRHLVSGSNLLDLRCFSAFLGLPLFSTLFDFRRFGTFSGWSLFNTLT